MTRLIVLLVSAAVLAAGCGENAGSRAAKTAPTNSASASRHGLPELTSIRQLQAAFDAHPDVPRLVILLSPT